MSKKNTKNRLQSLASFALISTILTGCVGDTNSNNTQSPTLQDHIIGGITKIFVKNMGWSVVIQNNSNDSYKVKGEHNDDWQNDTEIDSDTIIAPHSVKSIYAESYSRSGKKNINVCNLRTNECSVVVLDKEDDNYSLYDLHTGVKANAIFNHGSSQALHDSGTIKDITMNAISLALAAAGTLGGADTVEAGYISRSKATQANFDTIGFNVTASQTGKAIIAEITDTSIAAKRFDAQIEELTNQIVTTNGHITFKFDELEKSLYDFFTPNNQQAINQLVTRINTEMKAKGEDTTLINQVVTDVNPSDNAKHAFVKKMYELYHDENTPEFKGLTQDEQLIATGINTDYPLIAQDQVEALQLLSPNGIENEVNRCLGNDLDTIEKI